MTEIASSIPTSVQAALAASMKANTLVFDSQQDTHKPHFRRWFFQRRRGIECNKSGPITPIQCNKSDNDCSCPVQTPCMPLVSPKRTLSTPAIPALSPQGYLDAMIRYRGYSTKRYKSINSAYYNKPTALQLASCDMYLIDLVRKGNMDLLKSILISGISPNACFKSGETLVHVACRQGDAQRLRLLLDAGACLQVADATGRTPLHEAFWATEPAFAVVEIILQADVRLLHVADCRSSVPLSYARKEHWAQWIAFFESKKEQFWPMRSIAQEGEQGPPPLMLQEPNSRRLPDPRHALTPELAKMVVSGRMAPEEAQFLRHEKERDDFTEFGSENPEDAVDFNASRHSRSEDATDFTFNEDEMAQILAGLSALHSKPESIQTPIQTQLQEQPPQEQLELRLSSHASLHQLLDEYDSEDDSYSDTDDSDYSDSDCSDFDDVADGMADLLADLTAMNATKRISSTRAYAQPVNEQPIGQQQIISTSIQVQQTQHQESASDDECDSLPDEGTDTSQSDDDSDYINEDEMAQILSAMTPMKPKLHPMEQQQRPSAVPTQTSRVPPQLLAAALSVQPMSHKFEKEEAYSDSSCDSDSYDSSSDNFVDGEDMASIMSSMPLTVQ